VWRYYFEGHLDPQNKDSVMYLSSSFFINLDELASIGRAGINHLKAMLTANGTNIRLPFQPQPEWVSRIATFVGSTNDDDFLIDVNNVRWVVIRVDDIDFDYSQNIDINQIWAEAYALYMDGFDYVLSKDEISENEDVANSYKSVNIEEELMRKYFLPSTREDGGTLYRNADIAAMLQELNSSIRITTKYISSEMKKAGFTRIKTMGVQGYYLKTTGEYKEDYENRSGSRAYNMSDEKENLPF
jgi:predicted P-loop ATPase